MNTISMNGTEYISTREIEEYYGLTRNKAWQLLQKLNDLEFITIARLRHYPVADIQANFKTN